MEIIFEGAQIYFRAPPACGAKIRGWCQVQARKAFNGPLKQAIDVCLTMQFSSRVPDTAFEVRSDEEGQFCSAGGSVKGKVGVGRRPCKDAGLGATEAQPVSRKIICFLGARVQMLRGHISRAFLQVESLKMASAARVTGHLLERLAQREAQGTIASCHWRRMGSAGRSPRHSGISV